VDIYTAALRRVGFTLVGGADEAGRGACAGPLVAAAVILGDEPPPGLDDSKRLTPARRDALFDVITATAVAVGVACVGASQCDDMGMQQADLLGLRQAVLALFPVPEFVVTDGFPVPGLPCPSLAMWKGDQVVQAVSAASIIAKVTRDRLMCQMALDYPGYGFEVHKGYATAAHQAAIDRLGPCHEHRLSYKNVIQAVK